MDYDKLAQAMGDLDEYTVIPMIRQVAAEQPEMASTALEALARGMEIVGEKFGSCEYFIADLICAADIFTEAMEILRPAFPASAQDNKTKVILATVEGDLHDIGKNMVRSVLQYKGFQVIDLGVNVPPSVIVQKTIEEEAHIVALSGVLTYAIDSMEQTIKALTAAGIRDKVTVVLGGSCVNALVAKKIKADAFGKTPEDTAAICLAAKERAAQSQ